jgi:FkbM family methyltransferase
VTPYRNNTPYRGYRPRRHAYRCVGRKSRMLAPLSEALPCGNEHAHDGQLVVDVGFNVGQDTTAYLEAGYQVVAVEANPLLCEWARRTSPFREAIARGQLKLLNRAITGTDVENQTMPFFISEHSERNRIGSCYQPPCAVREVRTITCAQLLRRYAPSAYYLKCDVEGADNFCMASIAKAAAKQTLSCLPRYLSVEENLAANGRDTFSRLASLGYHHFKYADQSASYGNSAYGTTGRHGVNNYHGAGSGPFGEFAFDRYSRYAWRSVSQVQAANQMHKHNRGDLHMKLNTSWRYDARAVQHMLFAWQHNVSWPLSAVDTSTNLERGSARRLASASDDGDAAQKHSARRTAPPPPMPVPPAPTRPPRHPGHSSDKRQHRRSEKSSSASPITADPAVFVEPTPNPAATARESEQSCGHRHQLAHLRHHFMEHGYVHFRPCSLDPLIDTAAEYTDHIFRASLQNMFNGNRKALAEHQFTNITTRYAAQDGLMDLWHKSRLMHDIARNLEIQEIIRDVHCQGDNCQLPLPWTTKNWIVGSMIQPHSDALYHDLWDFADVGVVAANKGAQPEGGIATGNLSWASFHKSHVHMPYQLKGAAPEAFHEYTQRLHDILAQRNMEPVPALLKRGEVLMWSAGVVHGGGLVRNF